jgi:hypothetical protein
MVSRFKPLSIPFVGMCISSFFGAQGVGFTVALAAVFLAGVIVLCAEYVVSAIKENATRSVKT